MAAEVEQGLETQRLWRSRRTSRSPRTAGRLLPLLMCGGVAWALIAGCTESATSQSSATTQPAATVQPTTVAARDPENMNVRVLGLWSGPEFDSFVTVKSAWEQNTGGTVDWTWDQPRMDMD